MTYRELVVWALLLGLGLFLFGMLILCMLQASAQIDEIVTAQEDEWLREHGQEPGA